MKEFEVKNVMAQTKHADEQARTSSGDESATTPQPVSEPPGTSSTQEADRIVVVIQDERKEETSTDKSSFSDNTSAIAEIIDAIAWPVVLLIVVLIFRKAIELLISRLKKGKFAGSEVEFESLLEEAERDAPAIPLESRQALDPDVVALAENQPRSAVITAWLEIEHLIDELLIARGTPSDGPHRRSPLLSIRAIEKLEAVPPEYIPLLQHLRGLRNEASHSREFEPSPDSIIRYLQLSSIVIHELKDAIKRPTDD
jgi:hypothetical protein